MPSFDIVARALAFAGTPYAIAPQRGDCFDCIAFLNRLTAADIAPEWMDQGGPLPFAALTLEEARPGDVIAFEMPWPDRPHHAAVMVAGEDIDDDDAKITGPYFCHAAVTSWLKPYWRRHAVSAWRLSAC